MTGLKRPHFPTNTVHVLRLCMFQPTRRPILKTTTIETQFGKIRVEGRLGQQHLDVFESICYSRLDKQEVDGRIKILVDPWEVRKKTKQVSGETLKRIIKELETTIIEIIEPDKFACIGHLIDHVGIAVRKSDGTAVLKDGAFGERKLLSVEIGKAFCRLVEKDIWVGWNPEKIAEIGYSGHGITQAVIRHALSHKNAPTTGWKLDTLIKAAYGEAVSDEMMRWARMTIKQDAEKMAKIGILVEGDKVRLSDIKGLGTT